MYKFIDTNIDALSRKRKQPQRACSACRKKKKRCKHDSAQEDRPQQVALSPDHDVSGHANNSTSTFPYQDTLANTGSLEARVSQNSLDSQVIPCVDVYSSPDNRSGQPENHGSYGVSTGRRDDRITDSRFVGDTNPEGMFLSATSPVQSRSGTTENNVGMWLAQKLGESAQQPQLSNLAPPSSLFYGYKSPIQKMFLQILERDCFATLPPPSHLAVLRAKYFEKFHPVFPVIDESAYNELPARSSSRILLEQGMCLVASMDFTSEPHLILSEEDVQLTFRDFGRRTLAAMRILIETGTVTDKVVLMQALIFMSCFIDSHESSEMSSLFIGRAVQYLFSLGLHIEGAEREGEINHTETLFCCIWAFDRLNAAFQGRPTLIHERDIQRSLGRCFSNQSPVFRLVLHVIELLDQVIKLYRPSSNVEIGSGNDFTLFEELVLKSGASQVATILLATVEVLYHAIAVLSCRTKESEIDTLGAVPRVRQAYSADRITAMLGQEYYDQLVFFPFVPYAVKLSLSVKYREMRRSKVPMSRARARVGFEANSQILKRLGMIFWSASAMAELANITIKELDRVYAHVTEAGFRKNQQNTIIVATNEHPDVASASAADSSYDFATENAFDQDLQPFNFTDLPDLDPFAMFDPDFDLDAIDACLEGNLDLRGPPGNF